MAGERGFRGAARRGAPAFRPSAHGCVSRRATQANSEDPKNCTSCVCVASAHDERPPLRPLVKRGGPRTGGALGASLARAAGRPSCKRLAARTQRLHARGATHQRIRQRGGAARQLTLNDEAIHLGSRHRLRRPVRVAAHARPHKAGRLRGSHVGRAAPRLLLSGCCFSRRRRRSAPWRAAHVADGGARACEPRAPGSEGRAQASVIDAKLCTLQGRPLAEMAGVGSTRRASGGTGASGWSTVKMSCTGRKRSANRKPAKWHRSAAGGPASHVQPLRLCCGRWRACGASPVRAIRGSAQRRRGS